MASSVRAGGRQGGAWMMAGVGLACLWCGCAALEFKGETLGSRKGSVGRIGREEESEMNSQGTVIKRRRGKKDFKGDRGEDLRGQRTKAGQTEGRWSVVPLSSISRDP